MHPATPLTPADRFALIIEGLCQAVARRCGLGGLAGPFITLIWSRLRRLATRFARYAATPPVPSRPRGPRPARQRQSQPHPLPRRKAWLLLLVPETASGASQLRHFLADPEVAALLAAAPKLQSILRPLCHMLGIRAAGIRAAQALPAQALPPPLPPSAQPPDAPPHSLRCPKASRTCRVLSHFLLSCGNAAIIARPRAAHLGMIAAARPNCYDLAIK